MNETITVEVEIPSAFLKEMSLETALVFLQKLIPFSDDKEVRKERHMVCMHYLMVIEGYMDKEMFDNISLHTSNLLLKYIHNQTNVVDFRDAKKKRKRR